MNEAETAGIASRWLALAYPPAAQRDDQEGGKRKCRDQNVGCVHHHEIGGEIAFQVPPG